MVSVLHKELEWKSSSKDLLARAAEDQNQIQTSTNGK